MDVGVRVGVSVLVGVDVLVGVADGVGVAVGGGVGGSPSTVKKSTDFHSSPTKICTS